MLLFAHSIHEFIGYDLYSTSVGGQLHRSCCESSTLLSHWLSNPCWEPCGVGEAPTWSVSFEGIHVTLQAYFTRSQNVKRGPFQCQILIRLLRNQTHNQLFIREQKSYQNLPQILHPRRPENILPFAHSIHEFIGYNWYPALAGGHRGIAKPRPEQGGPTLHPKAHSKA